MKVRPLHVVAMLSAVAMLAYGCQAQSPNATSQGAPAANALGEANIASVRHFLDGMSAGDTTVVDSLVAESFVEHQAMPGMAPGREGLKAVIAQFHSAFPDLKFTINDIAADGDKVWVHSAMSGTMKGAFMGMKPTGKSMDVEGFDLIRFENAKFAEHWGAMDNVAMMQQLGASPPVGGKQQGAKRS